MNQTLSLSFAEPISIRELLLLLVRDTDLSVVPDPDVDGHVRRRTEERRRCGRRWT